MYCGSCGSLINEDRSFCGHCGAPIPKPGSQPTVPVQQIQPQYYSPIPAAAFPAPAKKSGAMAITGFVLGFVTLSLAWVIFFNILTPLTGIPGVIFSIIGIAKKNGGRKALAVIGLVACLVGMTFAALSWASVWSYDVYKFLEPIYKLIY